MSRVLFNKPPLSLTDQVTLLESRGMYIPDKVLAKDTLLRLNYYRFSGYALHFEIFENRQRIHQFKPGTSFDDVTTLYDFDTQLRALLLRYMEPVEVAFRAAICFELSVLYNDPHWYIDASKYIPRFRFEDFQRVCQKEFSHSREVFIESYKKKYTVPSLPPVCMMSEILSIGKWSNMFKHLVDQNAKKRVAQHFATKPYHLQSWMHCLSVLRNLSAHHCRIWNRNFTISPKLTKKQQELVTSNTKLAALVVILIHLLKPMGKNRAFQHDWNTCAFRRFRPPIPKDSAHLFRRIPPTCSEGFRAPIPKEDAHRFRRSPAVARSVARRVFQL